VITEYKCGHKAVWHRDDVYPRRTEEENQVIDAETVRVMESRECQSCRTQHAFELDCRTTVALETIARCMQEATAKTEPEEEAKPIPPTTARCTCTDNPCSCDLLGVLCNGCGKPMLKSNAWMEDGCPCNSPRGVNFKAGGYLDSNERKHCSDPDCQVCK